jgi:hypothetical protein
LLLPRTPENRPAVVVAEEASEAGAGPGPVQEDEAGLDSIVTSVEDKEPEAVVETPEGSPGPVFSLSRGRVPLALVPRTGPVSSTPLHSGTFHAGVTSPGGPSSIVDLYCDDEFKLSLEYQPNMVLYPVEGVASMESIAKMDGMSSSQVAV